MKSAYGYKRTFQGMSFNVCFTPESRHSEALMTVPCYGGFLFKKLAPELAPDGPGRGGIRRTGPVRRWPENSGNPYHNGQSGICRYGSSRVRIPLGTPFLFFDVGNLALRRGRIGTGIGTERLGTGRIPLRACTPGLNVAPPCCDRPPRSKPDPESSQEPGPVSAAGLSFRELTLQRRRPTGRQ